MITDLRGKRNSRRTAASKPKFYIEQLKSQVISLFESGEENEAPFGKENKLKPINKWQTGERQQEYFNMFELNGGVRLKTGKRLVKVESKIGARMTKKQFDNFRIKKNKNYLRNEPLKSKDMNKKKEKKHNLRNRKVREKHKPLKMHTKNNYGLRSSTAIRRSKMTLVQKDLFLKMINSEHSVKSDNSFDKFVKEELAKELVLKPNLDDSLIVIGEKEERSSKGVHINQFIKRNKSNNVSERISNKRLIQNSNILRPNRMSKQNLPRYKPRQIIQSVKQLTRVKFESNKPHSIRAMRIGRRLGQIGGSAHRIRRKIKHKTYYGGFYKY